MDEYIKRDAASKAVYQYLLEQTVSKYPTTELCNAARGGVSGAMEVLDDVPAADVAPVVHSEWDYGDEPPEPDENGNVQAFCKRCGAGDVHAKRNINKVPYCWKCGAKMDGGKK